MTNKDKFIFMKNIVTIGGGTGSYTVLSGLKNLPDVSLTALVSMADDGGSTGILRKKWKVMPPGDVRQCLAALTGREFLNWRMRTPFLNGHKVGNILLAVLEKLTGNFNRGLNLLSVILNSKGTVLPISNDEAVISAHLNDGNIIGESNIDEANLQSDNGEDLVTEISYLNKVKLNPLAEKAILSADYIIIGPGNMYCSIIPNLITVGFKEAISKTPAKIIFLINLVNKQGHTMNWGIQKYVTTIEHYLGRKLDLVLTNKEAFSPEQRERYLKDSGEEIFIKNDFDDVRIVREDLVLNKIFNQSKGDSVKRSLIRHDPKKLRDALTKII